MRDTLHIRSIMRKNGVPSSYIWTNKYKTKRTVKCWTGYNLSISALLYELRANGYTVRYNQANAHNRFTRTHSSIIVDAKL